MNMRRAFLSFLIGSLFLVAATFAGMAFFGMDAGMAMEHGPCTGSACHSMPGDASGMECVDHCLSAVPPAGPISSPLLAALSVALAVFLSFSRISVVGLFGRPIRRWHADIGKLILHQSLSTVVLRN